MERFLSGATRFFVLLALGLFFGVTVGLQLLFSGVVPEKWQFENLPRWMQVIAVVLALLYVVGEVWSLFHKGSGTDRRTERSGGDDEGKRMSDER
jgi:ammonia channel protein AmtB